MRVALLLACILACTTRRALPGAAGPAEAVQAFSDAIARGDASAAWALLSERTRRDADAIAAAVRRADQDAGPASGREMLFQSALPGGPLHVDKVLQSGDSADVLTSAGDGGAQQRAVHVVREQGVWRVDLTLPR